MSNTITHRPHAIGRRIPLAPVLAVIVAIAIAAAVILALNPSQMATTTTTGSEAVTAPAIVPATVAAPESPVFRHAQMRALHNGGADRAYLVGLLHHPVGTTLDPVSSAPYGSAAYEAFANQR